MSKTGSITTTEIFLLIFIILIGLGLYRFIERMETGKIKSPYTEYWEHTTTNWIASYTNNHIITPSLDDIELGFRSDGVVVWRKKE